MMGTRWVLEHEFISKDTWRIFDPKGLEDFFSHSSSIIYPTGAKTVQHIGLMIKYNDYKTAPPQNCTAYNPFQCDCILYKRNPPPPLPTFIVRFSKVKY